VSLIVPVTRRPELLGSSVAALLSRTDYPSFELLLAGERIADPATLPPGLRDDPRVRVLDVRAAEPAAALTEALACARGTVVGLLGLVEPITPSWLEEMVSHALRPGIGAVGAKLFDTSGAIAHAGIVLGIGGVAGSPYSGMLEDRTRGIARLWTLQNYSAVAAACLVARREVLEEVGGLDAANLPTAYYDVDLCLRLGEAGYRTVWTPYAELRWLDAAPLGSPGGEPTRGAAREKGYMVSRWGDVLHRDPNYNPNLSLERERGGFAVPPRRSRPWAGR